MGGHGKRRRNIGQNHGGAKDCGGVKNEIQSAHTVEEVRGRNCERVHGRETFPMVLKHAHILRACFKTIRKVSRPCTRAQVRPPTFKTPVCQGLLPGRQKSVHELRRLA